MEWTRARCGAEQGVEQENVFLITRSHVVSNREGSGAERGVEKTNPKKGKGKKKKRKNKHVSVSSEPKHKSP